MSWPALVELTRRVEEPGAVAGGGGDAGALGQRQAQRPERLVGLDRSAAGRPGSPRSGAARARPAQSRRRRRRARRRRPRRPGSRSRRLPLRRPVTSPCWSFSASLARFLASSTSGWLNGWMPSTWPAAATAISQRIIWAPSSSSSGRRMRTTGWPARSSAASVGSTSSSAVRAGDRQVNEHPVVAVARPRPSRQAPARRPPAGCPSRPCPCSRRRAARARPGSRRSAASRRRSACPARPAAASPRSAPSCEAGFSWAGAASRRSVPSGVERRARASSVRVDADHRRRHQAEVGQRRVAPAQVRLGLETPPEPPLPRQVGERAARVGDRREVGPGRLAPVLQPVPEVAEEATGSRPSCRTCSPPGRGPSSGRPPPALPAPSPGGSSRAPSGAR